MEARWGWAGRPPRQLSFQKNVIHTAKYNVFSFLPLNLYEQFRRFSNLYFLLIILLQVRWGQPRSQCPWSLHSIYLLELSPPGSPQPHPRDFPPSHMAL